MFAGWGKLLGRIEMLATIPPRPPLSPYRLRGSIISGSKGGAKENGLTPLCLDWNPGSTRYLLVTSSKFSYLCVPQFPHL